MDKEKYNSTVSYTFPRFTLRTNEQAITSCVRFIYFFVFNVILVFYSNIMLFFPHAGTYLFLQLLIEQCEKTVVTNLHRGEKNRLL